MAKKVSRICERLTRGSQPERARTAGGGRFGKAHPKRGGRRKGVLNTMTRELREAILNAAIRYGEDGKGLNDLEGYMFLLASEDRKVFGTLLRAVLPMEVKASFVTSVNIPYQTIEQAEKEARELGVPENRLRELRDYYALPMPEDSNVDR
jgi:hypothetical protein